MARPSGYPLLFLLPFILGCFLGACHAVKEDSDARSKSVALFEAPIAGEEEAAAFRHASMQYPRSLSVSMTSCFLRLPFKFIGAFLDYFYDTYLVGDKCYELKEAFRLAREAVRTGSRMMLYYLEHEGCSRIPDMLELAYESNRFACYLFF